MNVRQTNFYHKQAVFYQGQATVYQRQATIYQGQVAFYQGQAIVEVILILSFVMVAFFWGMKYIAMLGDLQFKAHLSSRYVAWEKTVHTNKNDLTIENEISKRILSSKDIPIHSAHDGLPVRSLDTIELDPMLYLKSKTKGYQRQVLWSEVSDTHHPRIVTKDVRINTFSVNVNQKVANFFQLKSGTAKRSELIFIARYHPELNLPHAGFALRSTNVMDYESWQANGSDDIKNKVKRTFGSQILHKAVNVMLKPISLISGSRIKLGIVLPDYVNCESLKNSGNNKVKNQCH